MNTRLRQMIAARRIVGAEEAERRRISRVLHDDVGQVLTALKMNLQRINSAIDKDVAVLKESVELVDQTLAQIRTLAGDLRPTVLDDLGLGEAVAWYAKAQAARAGYALNIEQDLGGGRFPTSVETCAFRIVQQALTNIARHAHAKNVRITMRRDAEALKVEAVDDGIGFDVNEARARSMAGGSLGIVHMTEMAEMEGGTLNICSTPGKGSTVAFRFPLGAST
jgi:two-component system sensor histidine kinase UhpB